MFTGCGGWFSTREERMGEAVAVVVGVVLGCAAVWLWHTGAVP